LPAPLDIAPGDVHVKLFDPPPVRDGEGHLFGSPKNSGGLHCSARTRVDKRNIYTFDLAASGNYISLATAHHSNRPQSSDGAYRHRNKMCPDASIVASNYLRTQPIFIQALPFDKDREAQRSTGTTNNLSAAL
jgi:hypothetical protein